MLHTSTTTATTTALALLLSLSTLTAAAPAPAPVLSPRQSSTGNFALAIGGGRFDPNYLQTFALSYANSSAYLGQIKYQSYSEPLIVSGADVNSAGSGLAFLSIHQTPTGYQDAYIVPHQTQPIGFSTPHGSPPQGVRTTGFAFNGNNGVLTNNGRSLFYACQNAELAEIESYQIWWWGAGEPNGVSCKGPLGIKQADGCARG